MAGKEAEVNANDRSMKLKINIACRSEKVIE